MEQSWNETKMMLNISASFSAYNAAIANNAKQSELKELYRTFKKAIEVYEDELRVGQHKRAMARVKNMTISELIAEIPQATLCRGIANAVWQYTFRDQYKDLANDLVTFFEMSAIEIDAQQIIDEANKAEKDGAHE